MEFCWITTNFFPVLTLWVLPSSGLKFFLFLLLAKGSTRKRAQNQKEKLVWSSACSISDFNVESLNNLHFFNILSRFFPGTLFWIMQVVHNKQGQEFVNTKMCVLRFFSAPWVKRFSCINCHTLVCMKFSVNRNARGSPYEVFWYGETKIRCDFFSLWFTQFFCVRQMDSANFQLFSACFVCIPTVNYLRGILNVTRCWNFWGWPREKVKVLPVP